jgi:hypothetical protein
MISRYALKPRSKHLAVIVLSIPLATIVYSVASPRLSGIAEPLAKAGGQDQPNLTISAPQIARCQIFPADNVWNTPVDKLKKDEHSDNYISMIGRERQLHPDFGSDSKYGIPYTVIPGTSKRVAVAFDYSDESDLGNYPIPPDAPIEGGSSSQGDRHILLIDKDRCILYELFAAKPQMDGSWKAGSGIRMDLTDNALREDGKSSADAAGLPILPGLVRYDEIAAGEIKHALRFTAPKTQKAFLWPARHSASSITSTNYPPMGTRFRLRSSFDTSGFSKPVQIILTALKRYGMILADNGGPWFLSGAPDGRWNDHDLQQLREVKGEDFEAVDESDWQVLPNSGRVDPMAAR